MVFLDYSNIFQQLSFHNAVTITDISTFIFGLHNNIHRAQAWGAPDGSAPGFSAVSGPAHRPHVFEKPRAVVVEVKHPARRQVELPAAGGVVEVCLLYTSPSPRDS